MTLRLEIVRTPERFLDLEAPWNELWASSGRQDPFLRHEWFACVLASSPVDLMTLLFWDGKELVGAAPLHRRSARIRSVAVRQLGFITVPDTFHADFLFRASRESLWGSLFDALRGPLRHQWDTLLLAPWPESSPFFVPHAELGRRAALPATGGVWSRLPVVPIAHTWEEFLQTRSVMFRKAHRGIANRIERLGPVEVLRREADPGGEAVQALSELSLRSWKAGKGIAIGANPAHQAFLRALTQVAERRGWLSLWTLVIQGRSVAMEYHLEHEGVAYALRADFDEAYRTLSPGSYLNYRIAQDLFSRKYREYNLGPGLNAYKLRWTDQIRTNVGTTVFNQRVAPLAAYVLDGVLVPGIKRLVGRSEAA